MKLISCLIVSLTLISCGTTNTHVKDRNLVVLNPELDQYVELYLEKKQHYTGRKGLDYGVIISIGDIEKANIAGYCYHLPGSIVIDREFWDKATYYQKLTVVFHEFGHCDLKLGHTKEKTIMYEFIINEIDYFSLEYYLEQFFRL